MPRFRKILTAIDFSPYSREAFAVAARFAAESDAPLAIVHVLHPMVFSLGEPGMTATTIESVLEDAKLALGEWAQEALSLGATRATTAVMTGAPWHEIVGMLYDGGFDLAVLGTHGRTGIQHVLIGSVAEKVVRHAPCTVMVVRPPR
ncbi:MAG: universal stress protein [Kofleriaceae bacterium]